MTESGEWKSAYQLVVGEKLISSNGELKEIESIEIITANESKKVYN